jgi:hypothetical protein
LTIVTEESDMADHKLTPNFGVDLRKPVDSDSDVRPFTRAYNTTSDLEYTHSRLKDILLIKMMLESEVLPEDS